MRLGLKFGLKNMRNISDLAHMALATQPMLWPKVESFTKGPSLADVLLKTIGKEMGKEEQCSDWSQELTLSQLTCESRRSECGAGVQLVFLQTAPVTPRPVWRYSDT